MGDKTPGGGRSKNFGKKKQKRLVGGKRNEKRFKKDRITYVDKTTPV